MKKLFGITAAMVTPFTGEGQVDHKALEQLTRALIAKGVDGLYPCGTTGEMVHLSTGERQAAAQTVVKAAGGRVPVFIHCGAMLQEDTIALVGHAREIGADGAGVVTPMFLGVNDRELEEYYVAVAKSVPEDFPIYLYNIPQCAANDLKTETVERIAQRCPNVVGIKYSFADLGRTMDYLHVRNGDFSVLHGCDRALTGMLGLGCDGTVSGCAGVFPEPFVEVYRLFQEGKIREAQKAQRLCVRICDILRSGSNMAYFKRALTLRGIPAGHMRAPQLDLTTGEAAVLDEDIRKLCTQAGLGLEL